MIRVLIVDDHAILRHGLRALLSDAFAGTQFGEAANAVEAMQQLRKSEWDVALLDITMPGKSGLELLKELKAEWPKLPVLVLSVHPADQFAVRARKAGAEGYMAKESAPEELVNAIRTILAGRQYVSPALAKTRPEPSRSKTGGWLLENGPRELERLFRAILHYPSAPLLMVDNDRHCHDASSGAVKLLGLSREEIITCRLDDFIEPASKPEMITLWKDFLKQGEENGTLRLAGADGNPREVGYTARGNVLPGHHLVVLYEKTMPARERPAWAEDYAFFLLNVDANIVAWYAGAERIFGYSAAETAGQQVDLLFPAEEALGVRLRDELKRSEAGGHLAYEGWRMKKNGDRFWASVITIALKDETGQLQGFAMVLRDFSGRQERDLALLKARVLPRPLAMENSIAGIVSGEFDRISEANDKFLELVGRSREDLQTGRLKWSGLAPAEYFAEDELAHEEGLRFGACTPFEKELLRKDGTRVPVLVATAVLKLVPFRWTTLVWDLSGRDEEEKTDDTAAAGIQNDFEEIIGRSPALKRLLGQVEVVAPTNATVLILGETGTGKELVARAVHRLSPRRERAFISLNCAAIPTGLLESELFGYERGAFTGALTQKIGRFEMAHKGTLFLDEVGDIPLDLQPKLLRALQEKSFERLGGTKTIPIDVRLVAATNRNLTRMMEEKLFRSDLYYRLKVFPIITPRLRDHAEDIPVLVWHFTKKYAREMNKEIQKIPAPAMAALIAWSWPGNVRELENFIERAVILSRGPSLNVPLNEIRPDASQPSGSGTLAQVEREHIIRVLREAGGVVTRAAASLGMPRTTLNAVMRRLGISAKGPVSSR